MNEGQVSVQRLTKDLANAAMTLSRDEARFLVDYYYIAQRDRIRADHQSRTLAESHEPHDVLAWLGAQSDVLESQIRKALAKYAEADPVGQWALGICGIGPVIAAGLLAHIDIEQAPTVGHIWRFGGLDSTAKWVSKDKAEDWIGKQKVDEALVAVAAAHFGRKPETLMRFATLNAKGEKVKLTKLTLAKSISRRPHNAGLKTLFWKIGESFVKVKGNEADIYGKVYAVRKELEQKKNVNGDYAEQAKAVLLARPTHAQKETYAKGLLPDGHIHARAKRYAVKLFLSHFHDVAYRAKYGKAPPLPYPIAHLGHAHMINPS